MEHVEGFRIDWMNKCPFELRVTAVTPPAQSGKGGNRLLRNSYHSDNVEVSNLPQCLFSLSVKTLHLG